MKIYLIVMVLYGMGYAFVRWSIRPALKPYVGPKFAICVALVTLLPLLSPNATIYGFALIAVFVATVRGRLDAVCRTAMMTVLAPAVVASLMLGSLFLYQSSTVQFLAVGLALALLMQGRNGSTDIRRLRGVTAEDAFVAILFVVMWIGYNRFPSLTGTLRAGTGAALLTPIPYLLFRNNLRSIAEVRLAALCLALASVLACSLAIYESRTGWLPVQLLSAHLNAQEYGLSLIFRGSLLRPVGATGNPLVFAAALVTAFIFVACSRDYFRDKGRFLMCLALLGVALVLCQSRGNLIVLGVACILLAALTGRKGLAVGAALLAMIVYRGLFIAADFSPQIAAFLNVGQKEPTFGGHYDYRGYLLERGMQEAARHRWLGASMDNVVNNLTDLIQGQHIIDFVNTYLVIYLVSGLIGIGGLVVCMVLIMQKLASMKVRGNLELRRARAMILVAFVAFAIELSFMSYVGCIPTILMFILAGSRTTRLDYARTRKRLARGSAPSKAESETRHPQQPDALLGSPATI